MNKALKDATLIPKYTGSYALIIGINKYATASPLQYAASDAKSIQKLLVEHFGFGEDGIHVLIDDQATRSNIMSLYMAFTEDGTKRDDRLMVYFAGHGETRSGTRGEIGFLIPHDGNLEDLSTLIRWDELTLNAELIQAKHLLFVVDACYGGLVFPRGVPSGSMRFLKDMLLRRARQVMTAGKADETVADSGGPRSGHSLFTGHLLDALEEGKAADENGIITANGVMSYVYAKVSTDPRSSQTPQVGYIGGDGDFIFHAPVLTSPTEKDEVDEDLLITIPSTVIHVDRLKDDLVSLVKDLIVSPQGHIRLDDLAKEHVHTFLVETSNDRFPVEGIKYSDEEFANRLQRYEKLVKPLEVLAICIAHWGEEQHLTILQKIASRATDQISPQAGSVTWNALRWYPILILSYSAGIAALAARRHPILYSLFTAPAPSPHSIGKRTTLLSSLGKAILEIERTQVFKQLPGHERQYVPRSEYIYKLLQPDLEDILFLGEDYENYFDEFEVLLALAYADLRYEEGGNIWGPMGRFGWKYRHSTETPNPLLRVIERERESSELVRAGFFGSDMARFDDVATGYSKLIAGLRF